MTKFFAAAIFAVTTLSAGSSWAQSGAGVVDHDSIRAQTLQELDRQYAGFVDASRTLAEASLGYCDGGAPRDDLRAAFKSAWLAWAPLDSYQFGPVEQSGAVLSINFWPDKKNFVGRALRSVLKLPAMDQRDPIVIASGSVGAQGFPALEMLIFEDLPACPALIGISATLHAAATQLHRDWFAPDGWADLARAAGPDNPVYQTPAEFTKTMFTALDFGLFRISEQRLGRPLGSFDRSFPKRAEAWRAGFTTDIVIAQLDGISKMIETGFAGAVSQGSLTGVQAEIANIRADLLALEDPISEAVTDPISRFRVEAIKTQIDQLRRIYTAGIGADLGVKTGFSPADGD